ncbi:hypothetical protein H2248_001794 [Termitomyces sp. 'cryptogamus']|nr:hypothetical protein H2248_001794 [Termitomyces sp. 'cryptogamus']
MKSRLIHKRLYSALPRAGSSTRPRPRSNSASLYTNALLPTESPPPPARLPRESKPHLNSVALTPSHADAPSVVLYSPWPLSDACLYPPIHLPVKRPRTHYRLDVGAYGIPKRPHRPLQPPSDPLHLAVQVGEDAYFIRGNALGVADGVGGWSKLTQQQPSPSALFARRLMHYTASEFACDLPDRPDMLMILERAYDNTVKAHTTPAGTPLHAGSSTALIAYLSNHDPAAVHLAQVGDSIGMVVRNTEIIWRSDEMWWGWNTPVQLSPPLPLSPPPRTTARIFSVPVLPDDILILASDGLSDNLWDEDVLDEVARFRRTWSQPDSHLRRSAMAGMLSEALCSRARSVSERKGKPPEDENETPFARRAREVGKQFTGGKRDDISVLVAIVAPATR